MAHEWSGIALTFPGQGSQRVGMLSALADAYPVVRETFEEADSVLGYSLSGICFTGPESDLNDTLHTQPALYVAGAAVYRLLKAEYGAAMRPAFAAGHSLGEFTALFAAEALTFADGLRLVQRRAQLMKQAGEQSPGAVAALLGLDVDVVGEVCLAASAETGGIVVVANDNCPGQVAISGEDKAVERAGELAQERGAKKVVRLAVSVAVHSPLMQSASQQFNEAIAATPIQAPQIPVVGNVTAQPLTDVDGIRRELETQLTGSVRWRESVETMLRGGATTFLELGPSGVLTGLLKRIDRSAKGISIEKPEDVTAFIGA